MPLFAYEARRLVTGKDASDHAISIAVHGWDDALIV